MKKLITISLFLLSFVILNAQKPSLDHSVYDGWKTAGRITIPNDGEWAYYYVSPQEGDASLEIYNIKTGKTYSIERGSSAVMSEDATRLVCKIVPLFGQTRQAKIDKKKPNEMPKDTLAILNLLTGEISKYPMLKSFKAGEKMGSYIAFHEVDKPVSKKNSDKEKKEENPQEKAPKSDTDQMIMMPGGGNGSDEGSSSDLYVMNIKTLAIDTIKSVSTFTFSKEGDMLSYITKPGKKDSLTKRGIFLYNPSIRNTVTVLTGEAKSNFGSISLNDNGSKLAFLANLDTTDAAKKISNIYMYADGNTKMIVGHDAEGIPAGWKISDKRRIQFYEERNFITFGICPIPREKDTTLVDFEQPKLDIWTWNEDYLPTVQQSNLGSEKNRSYLAKIDIDGNTPLIQLADEAVPGISIGEDNIQDYVIVSTDKPYRIKQQWDSEPLNDIYKVSLKDGSRELLFKGAKYYMGGPSPDGAYYTMYEPYKKIWYLYTLATGEIKDLTSALGVAFYNEDHDTPSVPRPYGSAIWSEDSKMFIIRDRFDYWQFDPTGAIAPFLLTEGVGRATNTMYSYTSPYNETGMVMMRSGRIEKDKPLYFSTLNKTTKMTGMAIKDITKKKAKLQKLVEGPYTYSNLAISKGKKPVYLYSRGNFEDGNNLWLTKDNFKTQIQLTDVNPQQREYNWGTVELVSWTTKDGIKAEGLLYKPENFDAAKKYPVILYFYEKNSDGLYAVKTPAPSRSTVNIPFFVSNEYIVFVPDIYYKDGHPGQSALNSILPACDMLCEYPWIDGDNMAIQGQSWGGYQVAYMITQTDRFKAAGAGAPVSNMTSAYGGIRWESGMVRQFQYEQQQSRIGKNLWDGFDLYIENSPIFFVPNVTTPVLIMHNDADGAVPWWQGIEFFTALKRCGKQAWMLQYNGEAHNLRERRNAKDLSIRLEQFFNHFLKGAPMPLWMEKGVPATLKGIELGY
ncbi:MAG: prolyl oligopeptidase family serine peptidase [Bacteroidales bacterium]|nr:prolyl oligopeptidase family serine peptidase [Bacteroidales bacterium]MDD4670038.1 prolyl oligopeptidase family serine peptidase [Bacteroidales bacterium]